MSNYRKGGNLIRVIKVPVRSLRNSRESIPHLSIVLYNVRDTPIDLEIITFILGIIPFKYVPIGANNW